VQINGIIFTIKATNRRKLCTKDALIIYTFDLYSTNTTQLTQIKNYKCFFIYNFNKNIDHNKRVFNKKHRLQKFKPLTVMDLLP
jgi:hypothetical protein